MIPPIQEIIDALTATYNHGQRLLLLFDYDGTLTPIVSHPRLAGLHPETRRILKNLACRPRIAIGIISGREIDDLKSMVGLRNIYYAGTSGLELNLCGTQVTHPQAGRMAMLLAILREHLNKILKMFPGAWFENKQLGLTVHYREVQQDHIPNIKSWVEQIASPFLDKLDLQDGPMAVEITPKLGWNKATAVQLILEHLGKENVLTLYAGDAPNDVAAIEYVSSIGGICIGIGPDTSQHVQFHLTDQAAFMAFIASLDAVIPKNMHGNSQLNRHCPDIHKTCEKLL
ncbi:MAG: trehalose-phosphatase [Thermoguttaceae bacterium]|jgi:trehalose-phosphatase